MSLNENIWGKTITTGEYYPLMSHMLDVGTMATVLFDTWLRPGLKDIIAEDFPGVSDEGLSNIIGYLSSIHDIGKCSAIFQAALTSNKKYHSQIKTKLEQDGFDFPDIPSRKEWRCRKLNRHEKLGAIILENLSDNFLNDLSAKHFLTLSTLGHHGSFSMDLGGRWSDIEKLKGFIDGKWAEEQEIIINALSDTFHISQDNLNYELSNTSIILISGLVIMADRLASHNIIAEEGYRMITENKLSIQKGKDWRDTRYPDFLQFVIQQVGLPSDIEPKDILGNYTPRRAQANLPKSEGICIIAEATGTGKTEAALLRHLSKSENMIFLLPTQSTTNAMLKRIQNIFQDKKATITSLAHGLAFLEDFYDEKNKQYNSDDYQGLVSTNFTKVVGSRLAASINVATIDQMLMGALPIKWTHLRLLILANSHIIIDEAHLFDDYQIKLLEPLLFFLGKTNTKVTILSATLPNWLEESFINSYCGENIKKPDATFPSIVYIGENNSFNKKELPMGESEKYRVKYHLVKSNNLEQTHIEWAAEKSKESPQSRIGIFVNQVSRAQNIALQLQESLPNTKVLCLHSQMLAGQKQKIVNDLLESIGTRSGNQENIIIVGTQIVEMSLDIDLDWLSTDLCPAPSLIQRLGRQWRDKSSLDRFLRIPRAEYQEVQIVVPFKDGEMPKFSALPYAKSNLQRAYKFLESKISSNNTGVFNVPEDVQRFVETVRFDDFSEDEEIDEETMEEKANEMFKAMKAGGRAINIQKFYTENLDKTLFQDFGSLTASPELNEELATRLIEYTTSTMILQSDDLELQSMGAMPSSVGKEKLETIPSKEILLSTISLSAVNEKALNEKNTGIDLIETNTGGKAYFGELPDNLEYNKLVGLIIK